ncbi:histone-like nucleoid-structuring protein Lsr2 [Nocardia sp. NPDC059239]|uniref:Lsr2 dimerization domain-containing protein n=1 Tax=Nocardia sp. NPDC059239 TaxID=3346785 RepID=UPI0036B6730C
MDDDTPTCQVRLANAGRGTRTRPVWSNCEQAIRDGRVLRRLYPCAPRSQTVVDDVDTESEADETVEFSVDGTGYETNLTAGNSARLRENLAT